MVSSGVLASIAVTVLARVHPTTAVAAAAVFSGLVAVLAGALVLVDVPGRHRDMRRSAALFGAGMTIWGIGQVCLASEAFVSHPTFPTLGDILGTAAAPLGVAGMLLAVRPSALR